MGVLRTFTVDLDPNPNPNGVYYAGQTINGAIQLDLKDEMKMRGIVLSFTGAANVKWTKISKEKRETFKSNEKYVDETIIIYGKVPGNKGKNPTHPSGNFRYPFQIQIPANIPSSFKGKFGQISYTLKATINKPWKINDNSEPIQLPIHRYIDLNREPNCHIAPQAEASSVTSSWLCCLSGTVSLTCSASKSGYTPGEEIILHGQIENNSGKRLHTLATKLTKEVTYYSKTTSHKDSEVLAKTKLSPVPQPDKGFWSGNLKLQLPISATPFRLDNCNIIDLKYLLHFLVTLKGGRKLQTQMEISVGSVALPIPGNNPPLTGHGYQNTGQESCLTMFPSPVQYGQGFPTSHTLPRYSSHHGHHQFQHGPPQISPSAPPAEFIPGTITQSPMYLPPGFTHHQAAVPSGFPQHQAAVPPGVHQATHPVLPPQPSTYRKSIPMGGIPTPFVADEQPVRPVSYPGSYPAPSAPSLPPPYTPFPN